MEPPPGPSCQVRPKPWAEGGWLVPPVRWVVKGVGVTQRGDGAPHTRRVPVVEVLQRISVLVISLISWPADSQKKAH